LNTETDGNKFKKANSEVEKKYFNEVDENEAKFSFGNYIGMFKLCSGCEKILIFIGFLTSILGGLAVGLMPIVLGGAIQDLGVSKTNVVDDAANVALNYFGLAIATCVSMMISKWCWTYIEKNLERRVRNEFFKKIMEHDVAWFDILSTEKVTVAYTLNAIDFVQGIGDCNCMISFAISQAITS